MLLLSACPADPPLTPPHTCLSRHPPSTKGRKRVEEASTKIGMLHVHPVVGLVGGQVVAVEQGAGVAHYGQKAGMRHVGRPTGPTGVHWTPSIGKARICCGTLLDISPPSRSKICSGVWPNISATCLHTGTWCWFLKSCHQNPSAPSTLGASNYQETLTTSHLFLYKNTWKTQARNKLKVMLMTSLIRAIVISPCWQNVLRWLHF